MDEELREMIRLSIEDSERWRGEDKPGSKTRRAIRPAVRGGSPERPYRAEEVVAESPRGKDRGRPSALVRVVGFIPHLQGNAVAGLPSRKRIVSHCEERQP